MSDDRRFSLLLSKMLKQRQPDEEYARSVWIDMFMIDGAFVLLMFMSFIIRDGMVLLVTGLSAGLAIVVYLWQKDNKKHALLEGSNILDTQIFVGGDEVGQQIHIMGYKYLNLPEKTIDDEDIVYEKVRVDEITNKMRAGLIRVGGPSSLRPEVIDEVVGERLVELKQREHKHLQELMDYDKDKSLIDKIFDKIPFIGPPKFERMRRVGSSETVVEDRTMSEEDMNGGIEDAKTKG